MPAALIPTALIVGAAASLWSDLEALRDLLGVPAGATGITVLAVNRAGLSYPGWIDHWVTLHPEFVPGWRAERRGGAGFLWSREPGEGVDVAASSLPGTGSSGLFAVRIALRILKVPRVILAGTPIDNSPHFYDDGRLSGPGFVPYRPEWRAAAAGEFAGRVRSLSGWTAELLGRPDPAWLAGDA